jgi:hypothetical protein
MFDTELDEQLEGLHVSQALRITEVPQPQQPAKLYVVPRSYHVHRFDSWRYGSTVFPDGCTFCFACECGAHLAHTSDGRSYIDFTHAVMPGRR